MKVTLGGFRGGELGRELVLGIIYLNVRCVFWKFVFFLFVSWVGIGFYFKSFFILGVFVLCFFEWVWR